MSGWRSWGANSARRQHGSLERPCTEPWNHSIYSVYRQTRSDTIITSGLRILTNGRIAGTNFSRPGKFNVISARRKPARRIERPQQAMLLKEPDNPENYPPPLRGSRPPSNTWFIGPTRVIPQTASRSVQPFLQDLQTWPTDRQTHRQRYSVCSYRQLSLAGAAMRINNNNNNNNNNLWLGMSRFAPQWPTHVW